ncbi:MAG: cystathionine gamma-synthase [Solirubrobacteraceae bacterium]
MIDRMALADESHSCQHGRMPDRLHPDTIAIAAGRPVPTPDGALSEPVTLASAFHAGGSNEYARDGHPGHAAFEAAIGALEGGHAVAFATGMAACSAILDGLPVDGVVVVPDTVYMGVRQLIEAADAGGRLRARWVDMTDTEATRAAIEGADLLWVETPLNPLLDVADLPALAAGARELGVPVAVDATVASPMLLRPLEHGATWSVHSATKYISGHGDLLLGVVAAADERDAQRLSHHRKIRGAVPGALEAFLALRGLRTLPLRMARSQANALELARRLHEHPDVVRVRYPGLTGDPNNARMREHMDGAGAVVSFEVAGGAHRADALCRASRLFATATSFGGVQSTMERRARWPQERGVPEALIRASVGCEDGEDLWTDLERALRVSGGDRRQAALGAAPSSRG